MTRLLQWLMPIVVAAALTSATPAEKPATPPAPAKAAVGPRVPPPYDKLTLTDAQKVQIGAKLHEKRMAIAEWETDHGVRRAEMKKELADAHAAHDDDKARALTAEGDELDKERKAIQDKYQAEIDAILTLEQHQELEGLTEYPVMMQGLSRAKPTDKQKEEIKAQVMKAAPEAYGMDTKTKTDVWSRARLDIVQTVMTPEQRLLLKPAPTTHPRPH